MKTNSYYKLLWSMGFFLFWQIKFVFDIICGPLYLRIDIANKNRMLKEIDKVLYYKSMESMW